MEYDPFGNVLAGTGSAVGSPFRYCGAAGYQTSPDSGLMLAGSRWYDPAIGRFLTPDPAGASDNPYAYCGNNPVSSMDPLGLFPYPDDPQSTNGAGAAGDSSGDYGSVIQNAVAKAGTWFTDHILGGNHSPSPSKPTQGLSSGIVSSPYDKYMRSQFGNPGDFSTIMKVFFDPGGTPSYQMMAWSIGGSRFGRPPDYIAINGGFNFPAAWAGFNGQVIASSQHIYGGVGGSVGSPGWSGSVVAGWLLGNNAPTGGELDGFLSGLSINGSAGAFLGGGFTYSPNAGYFDLAKYTGAAETGYYSPQFGLNFTVDGRIR